MKKFVIVAGLVLSACGVDPSMDRIKETLAKAEVDIKNAAAIVNTAVIDTIEKASEDTNQAGRVLNTQVNDNFEKTVSDINEESIQAKDNTAQEGGVFSERMKNTAKKANNDTLAEKELLRDRLVGSHDEQLNGIEADIEANTARIVDLEELVQFLEENQCVLEQIETQDGVDVSCGSVSFVIYNGEDGEDGIAGLEGPAGESGETGCYLENVNLHTHGNKWFGNIQMTCDEGGSYRLKKHYKFGVDKPPGTLSNN